MVLNSCPSVLEKVFAPRVIPDAGGVVEQMSDSDLVPAGGKVGQKPGEFIVDGEFVFFGQQHDRHGRELLGDGP